MLLSWGVRGDGGIPLRRGRRDGKRRDRGATPVAIEACLAVGVDGVRGLVAESTAESRRTLGWGLEHGLGRVTVVPRTCAMRQALAAWGRQPPALPLLVEKPSRTKDEAPRRWHGPSVLRGVEGEDRAGRVTQEEGRLVVVHSRQLAQQHAQTYASAQEQAAEAVADPGRQVHAQGLACQPEAEAAIAASEGQGPGRRGRRPRPWR